MDNFNNDKNQHLTLNGKVFLFSDILEKPIPSFPISNAFEETTLLFCKAWLMGKSDFEINTSGSTGKPKKVSISREKMIISAEMTASVFHLKSGDRILLNLPTKYIAGIMMLVRGLHLGLQINAVTPSSNPYEYLPESFDFHAFIPMQLENILANGKAHLLNKAKAIIVGGAAISKKQEDQFIASGLPIYSTFGMTETCTHVAIRKVGTSSFKALQGVKFALDERDCLIIHSPTAIHSPLITNDLVQLISDTEFVWEGRYDNIINTGGVKIQIEELEAKIQTALQSIGLEVNFAITAQPDDKLGSKIVMYADHKFDVSTVEEALDKYERPKEYVYLNSLPLTPTGKIDRKQLT